MAVALVGRVDARWRLLGSTAGPAGVPSAPATELLRILKPHGGVALLGPLGLEARLKELNDGSLRIERHGGWAKITNLSARPTTRAATPAPVATAPAAVVARPVVAQPVAADHVLPF